MGKNAHLLHFYVISVPTEPFDLTMVQFENWGLTEFSSAARRFHNLFESNSLPPKNFFKKIEIGGIQVSTAWWMLQNFLAVTLKFFHKLDGTPCGQALLCSSRMC